MIMLDIYLDLVTYSKYMAQSHTDFYEELYFAKKISTFLSFLRCAWAVLFPEKNNLVTYKTV